MLTQKCSPPNSQICGNTLGVIRAHAESPISKTLGTNFYHLHETPDSRTRIPTTHNPKTKKQLKVLDRCSPISLRARVEPLNGSHAPEAATSFFRILKWIVEFKDSELGFRRQGFWFRVCRSGFQVTWSPFVLQVAYEDEVD